MAFDARLAGRVRRILSKYRGVTEKPMFGGLCLLIHGNMCCGINKTNLMVRVGPASYAEALDQPHARPMDFTGRPLRGFVYVAPAGCRSAASLRKWVAWGADFAESLPRKR